MTIKTFVIPTTDYQVQLDEQDPFFVELQNITMTQNFAKRLELVNMLVKKFKPYATLFMSGKQSVFVTKKMSRYTLDDFLTDAAQCAYTNSTLPVNMQVK